MNRMPRNKTLLTHREARKKAELYFIRSRFAGATVEDGATANWHPRYGARRFRKEDVWVIFLKEPNPELALRSSNVIAVSKKTGRILYDGSANDEG